MNFKCKYKDLIYPSSNFDKQTNSLKIYHRAAFFYCNHYWSLQSQRLDMYVYALIEITYQKLVLMVSCMRFASSSCPPVWTKYTIFHGQDLSLFSPFGFTHTHRSFVPMIYNSTYLRWWFVFSLGCWTTTVNKAWLTCWCCPACSWESYVVVFPSAKQRRAERDFVQMLLPVTLWLKLLFHLSGSTCRVKQTGSQLTRKQIFQVEWKAAVSHDFCSNKRWNVAYEFGFLMAPLDTVMSELKLNFSTMI